MRRTGIAAATLAVLIASQGAARADGLYFTEAFGGTSFDNELSDYQSGGFHIHAGLGYRASRISFEVWFGGDIGDGGYDYDYEPSPDPLTYGMDFKYAAPVGRKIEIYARASVSRMEIDGGRLDGYGGRGLGVGTGAQIKGKAPLVAVLYPPLLIVCAVSDACKRGKLGPKATVALYVDQGYDFYRLHRAWNSLGSIDAEARRWSIGFAIGSDF